jgi:EAL domain-containing protein (putative c-di-GMP-specific phosphodiesterase class I)
MVYRMDGPNFALRIRNMDQPEAKKLYEQIRELGRNSVIVDGRHVALRISGGAMVLDEKSIQGNSVRACVTYAQEKSKHDYHSELVFFDNEREGRDLRQMEKIEFIRKCVLDGCRGFYMCYQPLVQAQTGKVAGMEALLRWSQPPYGDLLPGEFIQWLERDDCFFELGNWILRQSMIDALEFVRNQPEFIVNVNVSYTQIEREDFRDAVMGIIEEVHFPPENLCLELTERTRPLDQDYLLNVLEFFRSRGIKIALDDFGTGSASLNLLRKLPITCLKIDRMFISNIRSNPTDEIIVETLIESAKKLGMTVCVEGVENASLRDYLSKFNVNTHQGFFYSKPVRIEKFREFIPEGFAVS